LPLQKGRRNFSGFPGDMPCGEAAFLFDNDLRTLWCGKSSMAAEFAFQLGLEHFSTDIERKRLLALLLASVVGISTHQSGTGRLISV